MAWAFATVKHRDEALFAALARVAERRLTNLIHRLLPMRHGHLSGSKKKEVQRAEVGKQVANLAWALPTMNYGDEKPFAALAIAAEWQLREIHMQNVTNTAWAFATVNYRDETLFAALAIEAERRLSEFNPQAVVNTAWAVATSGG